MEPEDKLIKNFHYRLSALFYIRRFTRLTIYFLLLYGTVIIISRLGFGIDASRFIPCTWFLLVLFPLTYIVEKNNFPDRTKVRAFLDCYNEKNGLLISDERINIGEWKRLLGNLRSPSIRWNPQKSLICFAAALLFFILSVSIPERFVTSGLRQTLEIDEDIQEIVEKIEILAKGNMLEAERAESMKQKLEVLKTKASGDDPSSAWEALDHINSNLARAAAEGSKQALRTIDALARTEIAADAISQNLGALDPGKLSLAMTALSRLQLQANNEMRNLEPLSADLMEALKKGELTPGQLKELSKRMCSSKNGLCKSMKDLYKHGLIDQKTMNKCNRLASSNSSGLSRFLSENRGDLNVFDPQSVSLCMAGPGNGEISRGRGDAPMTWSSGTTMEGCSFKEEKLPPGAVTSLSDSKLMGVTFAAPEKNQSSEASKTGALQEAGVDGGAAYSQTILPRHRSSIRRYFNRSTTGGQ